MPDVLNPVLYRQLRRHFGVVRVSNRGEAMASRLVRDNQGAPRLAIAHSGEYYQVNCCYCHDTRFRLYINHMYGQRDDSGRLMRFLAVCYNDTACLSKYANQLDLYETLSALEHELSEVRVWQGVEVPEEAREVAWPGPCTRLDRLEDGHPARRYLESRSFDPDKIGRVYGAAYCHGSHYFLARDRIIVPVHEHGTLKGWQARYLGELDWADKSRPHPPKYFTLPGMPRRMLLYNYDRARRYRTGVIVEGPTDVWSFGPMAVCTFGCSMTDVQRKKFLAAFRRRTAVLLYDPEAYERAATRNLVQFLHRRMSGQFAAIKLPAHTDPGSLDRGWLRDYVADRAKRRGVTVDYTKQEG